MTYYISFLYVFVSLEIVLRIYYIFWKGKINDRIVNEIHFYYIYSIYSGRIFLLLIIIDSYLFYYCHYFVSDIIHII